MTLILDIATTLCIGLLIGTEFAVSAFINPVLWQLDNHAQAGAVQLFGRRLGTAMPFWYGMSFLLLIAETVVRLHSSGVTLLGIASGIWAAVIAQSIWLLVPINNRVVRMELTAFSEETQREIRKWDALHRWRVAALVVAMVMFLVGIHI